MTGTSLRDKRPLGAYRKRGPLGHPLEDESLGRLPGTDVPGGKPKPQKPPAFRKIPRSEFYRSLTERYRDPSKIHQRGSSLCGPASLMFLTGTYRPGEYRRFVTELYENGESSLGRLKIKPGRDCKNYDPTGKIAAADWVALAGIRDSENLIFDYDEVEDAFAGITLPSSLAGWLEKAHFRDVINETNLLFTKGEGNLREANDLHRRGYRVCLLIHADGIQEPPSDFQTPLPNHWVVLTSDMFLTETSVRFEIFTWGEGKYRVPIAGTIMRMDQWLHNYYGYVACRP